MNWHQIVGHKESCLEA